MTIKLPIVQYAGQLAQLAAGDAIGISSGGTGATTSAEARTNLGLGTMAVQNDAPSDGNTYTRRNNAWVVSGAGSVTSVAATGSTGLTVGGSPITSAGTLTFTLSANLQSWSGIAPSSKADASALGSYVLKAGDTMGGPLYGPNFRAIGAGGGFTIDDRTVAGDANAWFQFATGGEWYLYHGTAGARIAVSTSRMQLPIDLEFTGAGRRIKGDFSNGTQASRTLFQTSTVDGSTNVGAIPNGTHNTALFSAFSSSDASNASAVQMYVNGAAAALNSTKTGTGITRDLHFQLDGVTRGQFSAADGQLYLVNGLSSPLVSTQRAAVNPASTGRQVNVGQWGDISSNGNGLALFANNAYYDGGDSTYHYANTHGSIGARGLVLRPFSGANNGLAFFDTGNAATTAGAAFTPTLWNVYHAGNFNPGNYLPLAGGTMTGQAGMTGPYPLWAFGGASGAEAGFVGGGGNWGNAVIIRAWDTPAHGTFVEASLSVGTGFKVAGRIEATSYIQAGDATAGTKIIIGDDAGFGDVGVSHSITLRSQSDGNKGKLYFADRSTIDNQNDGWLRLNQDGHYANGVYTPGRITASAATINGNLDVVNGGRLYVGSVGNEGGEIVLSGFGGSGGDAVFDSNSDYFRWFGGAAAPMTWNRQNGSLYVPGHVTVAADLNVGNEAYNNGWYRSNQSGKGWFHQVHGGGWYMDDSWIKNYNQKPLDLFANGTQLRLRGSSNTIELGDTENGITTYIHHNDQQVGFLQNNAFSWAAYRDSGNNWGCVGNIMAYASDERLKYNIQPYNGDIIDQLEVREFDWNYGAIAELNPGFVPSAKHEVGGIAQQFEAVYPIAVHTHAHNGVKTIIWDKVVPLMLAEIQRLRKRVAALEA